MTMSNRLASTLGLACLVAVLGIAPVPAHPITVDGNAVDWVMVTPSLDNLGHIDRDTLLQGEYVWKDLQDDERTDFGSDNRVDIVDFRVTSDPLYLYFLCRMQDIDLETGDGAPQVQIAIDRDFTSGSGESWFARNADTQVNPLAEWEYLIVTRFGSAVGNPSSVEVWMPGWSSILTGSAWCSATNDLIEIRVPWIAIDDFPYPTPERLRFTVATFRANASDNTWDTGGPTISNALDCVTNYGNPGDLSNTWIEVSDQVVNSFFDVWFEMDGDPKGQLLITEIMYDPTGPEPAAEWVEIYNNTALTTPAISLIEPLTGYKVGDEETYDSTEGMYLFPSGSMPPASLITWAVDGLAVGFVPNYEIGGSPATDTPPYTNWATGSTALANTGDEVLLLDNCDTVIDVITWGTGTWPGVEDAPMVSAAGHSICRNSPSYDTNDGSVDCHDQFPPTPGSPVPAELSVFTAD